jgi:gliding motility-associated protein GldM
MAGGKETPRQKMVGMMYLVLTALLALQVSNTILDKFVFIDESLQYSVEVTRKNTDKQIKGGADLVEKQGNTPKDVALLKKAEDIKKKSEEVYSYITKVREDLIKMTGGKDEKGGYVGAKNDNEVMLLMLGDVSKGVPGEAKKMKETLNNYTKSIAAMDSSLADLAAPIAVDAKDMPMYAKNNEQNGKDFGLITFDQTPTVAALAILSDIEAKVARVETKAVDKIISKIGGVVIKFDKILGMASAESQVVAAGTKYKAKMFISASSTQIKPTMRVSQGSVSVKGDVGEVEFTAPPATDYNDQGLAKRKWQGSITIKKADGQDTTFKFDQEYFIAKPIIKVQSGNVSALYLNCGNDLQVDVPALGASYDPSFTATGAEVIKSGEKGKITVVPSAANVELNVSSGGNRIGSEKFKVKLLPKPELKVVSNGKPIDEKQGGACPRNLKAVATAEASVREAIPRDARYKVTEWEITLARGRRAVKTQKFTSDEANMGEFAQQSKEGDRLVIEIKAAMRMNFKNATERVNGVSQIFQYPITQ